MGSIFDNEGLVNPSQVLDKPHYPVQTPCFIWKSHVNSVPGSLHKTSACRYGIYITTATERRQLFASFQDLPDKILAG